MKTKRRALSSKNRPRGLGLQFFAIVWLLMDRFSPPGWVWGVVGCLCALLFLACLHDYFDAEDVDLL